MPVITEDNEGVTTPVTNETANTLVNAPDVQQINNNLGDFAKAEIEKSKINFLNMQQMRSQFNQFSKGEKSTQTLLILGLIGLVAIFQIGGKK